ncbi:MAG: hypothetical protein HC854_03995 [Flavobacterium sp.]|nr:hypothetical protein [Flavobacterium sp.]
MVIWIARNKYSYTNQELIAKKTLVQNNLTPEAITLLWDNLFYQVITNKNFYVKEAIMQMLIADNLIKNFVNDNTVIVNLVNAKVILPKELFVEKEETTSLPTKNSSTKAIAEIKDDTPEISLPSETMQQFQAVSMAELEIEKYRD